ncbi:DEAD/DEAH box helicase [Solidesulfovibrio carbinolicus]|nr:DEAD/DEAH box helicase [Solidesulfovibrio carbinolicus]
MSLALIHTPNAAGVLFQVLKTSLLGRRTILSPHEWKSTELGSLSSPVSMLWRALDEIDPATLPGDEEGRQAPAATLEGTGIQFTHQHVASLGQAQAHLLGLPPCTPLCLSIQSRGIISQDDFNLDAAWLNPQGQRAIGALRVGSMIQHKGVWQRLPKTLYDLASAIDACNEVPPGDQDERRRQLARLTASLPQQAKDKVERDGYLDSLRVYHAAALSLRLKTSRAAFDVEPVLFGSRRHGAKDLWDSLQDEEAIQEIATTLPLESEALLPPALHDHFAKDFMTTYPQVRSSYVLGDNRYVFIEPVVREALALVKDVQQASPEMRRDFARNPQRYFQERLGERFGETVVEAMFVVTQEYSQRVVGLGLWIPTILPWVKRSPNTWRPESYGLQVEDKSVTFGSPEAVAAAIREMKAAMERGQPSVDIQDVAIPAAQPTLDALNSIANLLNPVTEPEVPAAPLEPAVETKAGAGPIFIEVAENVEENQYCSFRTRVPVEPHYRLPHALHTPLKPHQQEALDWLIGMWSSGTSGALLADDMGLGKTLASLAFLAWLQERRLDLGCSRKPILIVAPTSLIGNWQQEVSIHLDERGLGNCIEAHGPQIRRLRLLEGRDVDSGSARLDVPRLQEADWVLTTYETLRDYHHSFAVIPWSAVVFDEMQKAKNPASQITRAVKTLRADFSLGLTGTPIENSLADLWSIMDVLLPGFLVVLKEFMASYAEADMETLRQLKAKLEGAGQTVFRPMLRRMKNDTLQGLPTKTEHVEHSTMPPRQAQAYENALRKHGQGGAGSGLQLLLALRLVSLHPEAPDAWIQAGDAYIGWSARLTRTMDLLDTIYSQREKALIFLESLELQAVLAVKLKERYRLGCLPFVINGKVPGAVRQQYVQAFQENRGVFDVMILSPRAGGVGLTLTAANHVIHLSRWWNPAIEDQCTDRIYRIGQDKDVHVYYPMAIHSQPHLRDFSFDLRLHELLEHKRKTSKDILLPPEDGHEAEHLTKGVIPIHVETH